MRVGLLVVVGQWATQQKNAAALLIAHAPYRFTYMALSRFWVEKGGRKHRKWKSIF